MSEENNYENRPYGFPRDLFASVKLYGFSVCSLYLGLQFLLCSSQAVGKSFQSNKRLNTSVSLC